MKKQFRCKICGYIYEGDSVPEKCPQCQAPASEFEVVNSKKAFLGGKNTNAYIIFYSTIMVVIVAAVLAFAALYLKPYQEANMLNEKKDAILASIGAVGQDYDRIIKGYAVDADGAVVEGVSGDQALDMLFDLRGAIASGTYPIFQSTGGEYVVPVIGKGLWDDIWGYVALEADLNTIKGAVFSHKGETPGLGAEIATEKYQSQFVGKQIYDGSRLVSISVVKGGADKGDIHAVDAVTGGTKTSIGLQNMLKDCLTYYAPFFEKMKSQAMQSETMSNQENVQDNE